MESRIKILGHPPHQMLVTLPLGGLGFAFVSDVLHSVSRRRRYADAARQALDYSLIAAAVAAPFGTLDWLAIERGTRAKRVGAWHALGNVAALGAFGASRWLRRDGHTPSAAKWLSAAGMMISGVTAWLGGELVNRHGIGVQDKVGRDLPSSLSEDGMKPITVLPLHASIRDPEPPSRHAPNGSRSVLDEPPRH